jgi:aryl-alcohol dehydrogenase-like predicted oxidoreductase
MRTDNTKAKSITKSDMKTKRLGNSDLAITPIGFGAWAIGSSGWEFAWGDQDDKASIAAIYRALEFGVNWIDTAAVYGMGHSEEIVASALKTWPGPRPYVFTKCGLRWDEQGYVHNNLKAKSIRRECEDSLRRLGTRSKSKRMLARRSFSSPIKRSRRSKVGRYKNQSQ